MVCFINSHNGMKNAGKYIKHAIVLMTKKLCLLLDVAMHNL